MKTSELTGAALDWAVATSAKLTIVQVKGGFPYVPKYPTIGGQRFSPSTDWAQGGPIIEREGIAIRKYGDFPETRWQADDWQFRLVNPKASGPTPLIAAMRCLVACKLGDEVDIPKELT